MGDTMDIDSPDVDLPPPPLMKGGDLPALEDDPESNYLTGWLSTESVDTRTDQGQREFGSDRGSGLIGLDTNPMAGQQEQERLPEYSMLSDPELSKLAPAAIYDLNQAALEDAIPNRPLIAPLTTMDGLRSEYENGNPVFVQQIDWLVKQGFIGIRRTRGDGDCFYRSLAFAYIERLLTSEDKNLAVAKALSTVGRTPSMLDAIGFEKLVYEDFFAELENLILRVVEQENGEPLLTHQGLVNAFNNDTLSNSIVLYLRFLTSAQIQLEPDDYAPFLIHPEINIPMEPREFCVAFVESPGKEADHVQANALTRALGLNMEIAYLDGKTPHSDASAGKGKSRASDTVKVDFVSFDNGEEGPEPIRLLYRPGHYDILERRSEDPGSGLGLGVVALP